MNGGKTGMNGQFFTTNGTAILPKRAKNTIFAVMTLKRTPLIIHGFAILHALVSILCLAVGVPDSVLLTLLTITMTVLLALRYSLTIEITALTVVLVNITGFFLGTLGARLFALFIHGPMLQRAAATFVTTEILGWTMALFSGKASDKPVKIETRKLTWLILAALMVFITRIIIDIYFGKEGSGESFFRTFLFAMLAEAAICTVLYMVKLAIEYREEARRSESEARQAEFRYMTLKHQVNPHFLFNSLNILDSLVLDRRNEEADTFIHKLAGIYRYMTAHEGERLVRLSDELTFTKMYADLLNVRFQGGFSISSDIRDEDLPRKVIPCSVQLLVENAIKHNVVSADNPLEISISTDGENVTVRNSIRPKLSHGPSTGLGQKYIRQQYKDISAAQMSIESTPSQYIVHLPLL